MKDEEREKKKVERCEIQVTSYVCACVLVYVCTCVRVYVFPCLPGYNPMHTLADEADVHDLHRAQIRFGGDVFLKPRTERSAEEISEDG